jgi:nucleotide-binding universal stress UspA family protein
MFRRILVPVDGSTFAEHALPYAVRIARDSGAELELALVHVSYMPVTADVTLRESIRDWEGQHRQREAEYLNGLAERLAAESRLTVRPALLDGDIAPALEQTVRDRGIDLVVMTTHGRAGMERAWLGSVADALIRDVDPPVLLIRPPDDAAAPRAQYAEPLSHVLVALDGSERSERALPPAAALARADGAKVTLVRVIAPPKAMTSPFIPHAAQITRDELREREESSHAYLREKERGLAPLGLDIETRVLVDYHPAHALLRYADAHAADLVALGVHGRGPIGRLVLGSVSDKVVRAARAPVLIC